MMVLPPFQMGRVIVLSVPLNNVLRVVLSQCHILKHSILTVVDMIVSRMEVGKRESTPEYIEIQKSSMP